MGTEDLSFVQLNLLIGRKTGGISVYPFKSSVRGKDDPCSYIIVRGKAISGRGEDLYDLVNSIIQDVQFEDQHRFKQIVSDGGSIMMGRLRGSGHEIVSYLEFLLNLEERIDQDWADISSSLEEIRKSVFSKQGCLINITADGKSLTNIEKAGGKFVDLLPSRSPITTTNWSARLPLTNEAIVTPTHVNYVGKAANIYDSGYEPSMRAFVISKHIRNTWLWDRVRVSGGAYSVSCRFNTNSGVFMFLSNRAPNLLKTLDVYDGTGDFLRKLEMDNDTLTKAIRGTIGDIYPYRLPDSKGYMRFVCVLMEAVKDKWVTVAVGSPEDVDAANKERLNFFQVEFGAEVAGKSERNEEITTKPRRPKAEAYAYASQEAMHTHLSVGGTPKC
ncbi:hypothetical protein PIB30_009922 [Stylosanthes scabra]|uniref:Uncharacterized protein n=1 Tax=Stylosanthes scabra TaxID=79078 RepID=A0ABU6S4U4_9FABA|nr:hypothetical protein [Stylosanthes scabra]